MALVTERIWRSGPRKVKRAAWGYTVQLEGTQVDVSARAGRRRTLRKACRRACWA
jgi:hypothetical protein